MVRELLDETRQASLDEAGRKRLADVYQRAVERAVGGRSPSDLKEELAELAPPLEGVPTESEIRVAQAQLVGWLEGLFHGIQAAMFAQQAAARAQFEELRRRGLPGRPGPARRRGARGRPASRRPVPLARRLLAAAARRSLGRVVARPLRRALAPPPASRCAM